MYSVGQPTYKCLIKLIPPGINLGNVTTREPCKACSFCAPIIPDHKRARNGIIKISYERIDLYPDFPGLKTSAKVGCGLCRLMRKSIRINWGVRPMEEWGMGSIREKDGLWDELLASLWDRKVRIHDLHFALRKSTKATPMAINTGGNDEDGMVMSLGFQFGPATRYVAADGTVPFGEIGQLVSFKVFDSQDIESINEGARRILPSLSALSDANIELASKWISECKSCHPKCHLGKKSWVPTRLLDIGREDGSELPRLVEATKEDIQAPYAALSHMWGNSSQVPLLQTIESKYEVMKSGIPMRELSKNFADAVVVTRKLGLQYVWIDSLCIIQDSLSDWNKEAATMHNVYRYAEITIAATSATSAHQGFLERSLEMVPAEKVGYSLGRDAKASRSMTIFIKDDSDSGSLMGDIEGSPWNRRGWTMQERSLSTRILHFCKNKIYFECRTCITSEENEGLQEQLSFHMWPRNEDWMRQSAENASEAADVTLQKEWYKRWTRTVSEYSLRSLTKDFDKLPAIQGIAAEMSASVHDTYIPFAGMWRENLKHELLWQAEDGPVSVPSKYRAPTWSWASLDAKVIWNGGFVSPTPTHSPISREPFEILDIGDHIAEIAEGNYFLTVRAFLKPLSFAGECDYEERWVYGDRGVFPYDLFVPALPSNRTVSPEPLSNYLSLNDRQEAIKNCQLVKFAEGRLDLDDRDGLTMSQRRLFYLHVNNACRPSGLILESVKGAGGFWRRVGVAAVFGKRSNLFFEACFAENEGPVQVTIV